jgi:hypothetical protein
VSFPSGKREAVDETPSSEEDKVEFSMKDLFSL